MANWKRLLLPPDGAMPAPGAPPGKVKALALPAESMSRCLDLRHASDRDMPQIETYLRFLTYDSGDSATIGMLWSVIQNMHIHSIFFMVYGPSLLYVVVNTTTYYL